MAKKPHPDKGVERARQAIRDLAAKGDKSAQEMLKGVEKDEKKEERDGYDSIERP
jgi:hypothetical protein